ncbi:MAG: threonine ammonia-lyase [Thaumarchaeota archaeon]|nr:threonine ammonia-lyase [Nitrososphaerota archaeon]MCY3975616.1 threonine ammonia-lyase [Nitrososphaerota archaeon]
MKPTLDDVIKAQSLQCKQIIKTPLAYSQTFSKLIGSEVYLKQEFLQKTGSFKIRGAYFKIKSLTKDEKKHGVVAASAGNHAQGVAFASSLENIKCTIVMPKNASPAKVAATRSYGANVVLSGINYDESFLKAVEIRNQTQANIIHAFDDPHIIAAQGVIGLEILEKLPNVDEIYVPIGGGGLVAGILIAIKTKHPEIKIVGVQSKSYPSMKHSLECGKVTSIIGKQTIADGISVSKPGKLTFNIINKLIDNIVLVNDSQIIKTMFLLMERTKMIVEPAGVVGLAHLLDVKPKNKKIVSILGGGNVDMYLLGQIVSKGLSQMGRLIKIFVLLPDKPGTLQTLVNEITSLSINIVEVLHDRLSSYIDAGTVGVILSLETENKNKAYKLLENLKDKKINFRLM